LHEFLRLLNSKNIHFIAKFYLIISDNDKIMLFEPSQPLQLSAFQRHAELAASKLSRAHWTLQIWTHWTSTYGLLCLGHHILDKHHAKA